MNPISYYGIALTLTGLLFFFVKEFFMEQTSMEWLASGSTSVGEETFENTIKYQSIISVLSIPLYALFSKIIFFRNKQHNYAGHIIINLYLFAQYTIASFFIYLLFLLLGINYMKITYAGLLFYMLYTAYGLKRIFRLSVGKIIWKTFLFLILMTVLFIAAMLFTILFTYLTGGIEGLKNMGKPT